jgi:hypothetical protein
MAMPRSWHEPFPTEPIVAHARHALALTLVLASGACSRHSSADPSGPGEGPVHVTGRLLDAETGRPVSRKTVWIHGFNDTRPDPKFPNVCEERSLAPDDPTTFAMNLLDPTIRLRVYDKSHAYEMFEVTLVAHDQALDVDVRLRPTHWVRLHGRVFWREGGALKPFVRKPERWKKNQIVLSPGDSLEPDEDGNFSHLVPRELLKVLLISSERRVTPHEVDLREERGDEHAQDFVFEE